MNFQPMINTTPIINYPNQRSDRYSDRTYITAPVSSVSFPAGTQISPVWGKIAGKIADKVKSVGNEVIEKVSNYDTTQKINQVKLTKLMISNGTYTSILDAGRHMDEISELAKLDYDKVEAKYLTLVKNLNYRCIDRYSNEFYHTLSPSAVMPILTYEKLTDRDIDQFYQIKNSRKQNETNTASDLEIYAFVSKLRQYENFDNLSARGQKSLIDNECYDHASFNGLTLEEARSISDYSPLAKFEYVRDLKSVANKKEFVAKLNERRKNIPCVAIPVDKQSFNKVLSNDGIENLKNALSDTDLTKYQNGFTLEYSRQEFIKDFTNLTRKLSPEDKKRVFDYFQFKTDGSDIENYPNPNGNPKMQYSEDLEKYQELVDKFMLNNRVKLDPEDKELENSLNDIIQAFPEFVSVIGKKQHRGDTIDYHTFDDLKKIMNNPEFSELEPNEQKILTVATLFHDFGKAQDIIDDGHALKSAMFVKEIIKKTELSFDERERIYNLIKHSHWLVDGSKNDDIAFYFRRPNDFKMAEIFEKADSESSGFEYSPNPEKIAEIKENIDKINSTGIPVFADSLPSDLSKYDVNEHGVPYIDLRDPEASVEKYGYPAGTKVKDLKFLCHSSSDDFENFAILCDDSKDVCLSTMMLDRQYQYTTGYNYKGSYIVSGNNANIVLGGKNLSCSGGHRGYDYAKNSMYCTMENLMTKSGGYCNNNAYREDIPNEICEKLDLSKEEYLDMYNQICNLENLNDIEDMTLSSGRNLTSDEVKKTISDIRDYMVSPRAEGDDRYINEFVVYNPKIEGAVVRGDINMYRESKVPLVLV